MSQMLICSKYLLQDRKYDLAKLTNWVTILTRDKISNNCYENFSNHPMFTPVPHEIYILMFGITG